MSRSRLFAAALAAVCVAAGGPGLRAQSRPTGETDLSNPLWSTPLASLSATRERPLFAPTRRPPPAAAAAAEQPVRPQAGAPPPPPPTPPPFTLVGTAFGDRDMVAVLFDQTANKAISLRVGASASGWSLKSVKRRSVEIERDGAMTVLTLADPAGGAAYAHPPGPAGAPMMPGQSKGPAWPLPGLRMPGDR